MRNQNEKSTEFIQQKYIQLLEQSNVVLHKKSSAFSLKNIVIYSSLFTVIILLSLGFYHYKSLDNDLFKNHLTATSYNPNKILLETPKGIFYQITQNTDKKWITDSGIFIEVNNRNLSFTATKKIPIKNNIYYTLWIPQNKQYFVKEIDGTNIQLNANSQLTFSLLRATKKINAILKGEAFFDVAHNQQQPYSIKASDMHIEVLGTKFNVTNYTSSDKTSLALVKGSVKVSNPNHESKFIIPGQEVSLQPNNKFLIKDADFSKILAWNTTQLFFTEEKLETILLKIENWYNVAFTFKNENLKKIHFTGNLLKKDGLVHFLEMLQYTEGITYKINNKEIILYKRNSNN